ncbi:MAG: hypothetical protein B7Y45_03715 [Sphingomonas sp. 28-66-16]|nr:MAG: hypothetical protein B7Y45_03715 [Sphingomonas sp. 28-66-16]
MTTEPEVALKIADAQIAWVCQHPGTSGWLKATLREALAGDPVAIANDVELLHHLLQARATAWVRHQLDQAQATPRAHWPDRNPGSTA